MRLREALISTINKFKISGRSLAQATGMTEPQISVFRTGNRDNIELKNFEKLVEALPPEAYHHFWCQIALDKMDSDQLYELIMMAVTQMKEKKQQTEERVLVLK